MASRFSSVITCHLLTLGLAAAASGAAGAAAEPAAAAATAELALGCRPSALAEAAPPLLLLLLLLLGASSSCARSRSCEVMRVASGL